MSHFYLQSQTFLEYLSSIFVKLSSLFLQFSTIFPYNCQTGWPPLAYNFSLNTNVRNCCFDPTLLRPRLRNVTKSDKNWIKWHCKKMSTTEFSRWCKRSTKSLKNVIPDLKDFCANFEQNSNKLERPTQAIDTRCSITFNLKVKETIWEQKKFWQMSAIVWTNWWLT